MARNSKTWEKEFAKRKNLLDIRHQRYLNYFNILAISMVTIAFSSIIGYFSKAISAEYFATFILVDAIVFGFLAVTAFQKMNAIYDKIIEL